MCRRQITFNQEGLFFGFAASEHNHTHFTGSAAVDGDLLQEVPE
jgi:hypothetical protein